MFGRLGPDTGFDSIGDFAVGRQMSKFFDMLDRTPRGKGNEIQLTDAMRMLLW